MTTRVLVTGTHSRACNPAKNEKDVLVSWLLAEACRRLGYEVEHRNPRLGEDYAEFDHVFLGLIPFHSLGCNRSYGALAAFLRTYRERRVTLYLDDINVQNVENGVKTMYNDPNRFFKPFYRYRLEHELAVTAEYRDWLIHGIEVLRNYAWPTTILPLFPWGNPDAFASLAPRMLDPLPIDLSALVPDYSALVEPAAERETWITQSRDERWLERQQFHRPLRRLGRGFESQPTDAGLVVQYSQSFGVLDRGYDHGWWSSRPTYAAQARTPYVTKWQTVVPLGEPYTVLPANVEDLDAAGYSELAAAQAATLAEKIEPLESVLAKIKTTVEEPS